VEAKFKPLIVTDDVPEAAPFDRSRKDTDGASNENICPLVPTRLDTDRSIRLPAPYPVGGRQLTVETELHDVVEQSPKSSRVAVGVKDAEAAKLRPEIVTEMPALVAMFALNDEVITAASKLKKSTAVPIWVDKMIAMGPL